MEKAESTKEKRRVEVEMRDRISDLPDSLLLQILSLLPIQKAIATSFLSKRWRPLWLSLPILYLDFRYFQRLTFFTRFVDKLLSLVDLKSVTTFVFYCKYYKNLEYFEWWKMSKWIDAVISNRVQHLELHFSSREDYYELPSSVFTASSIKVLRLNGVMVGTLSCVNLPLLQVLHLEDVQFKDVGSLEMLLSSCPLLKHLVLKFSYGGDKSPIDIRGLNHLVTAKVPQSLLPLEALSNVTFLRLYENGEVPPPKLPQA
ncbi:F-box/FBD/LRR-repeat protein At5g22660 [Neltuma alba]|uniref:F-box/FBD/LRR-repeat protein At5g22660 n=1 Tax=Neltuma alba TaxID=207710 RepID=UPI0010A332EF|nr:F-box/FBD/LRR-repeat protein At5g22660-like [Prosopis alba]XP_028806325.1 F-box/FBD/LRR-repeat protein At5g22660-like [Prosopis alba]XP_028806326.1 F-box/FBD/LRR-repeat protein At5g22660-like [Prosopis alba]XP_028806327.1 F-box/FBD/LRR-repeat protein At5g22660-like [Prosopis alba]XP_028806328.1 F-box/FBD/LRR-repeat protein At5g22660-like [Prosopis alba]